MNVVDYKLSVVLINYLDNIHESNENINIHAEMLTIYTRKTNVYHNHEYMNINELLMVIISLKCV